MVQGLLANESMKLRKLANQLQALSSHPMLIPAILCELVNDVANKMLNLSGDALVKIENRMGLHMVHGYPQKLPTPDFDDVTRSLNIIGTTVSLTEKRVKSIILAMKSIMVALLDTMQEAPPALRQSVRKDTEILKQRIENLSNLSQNLVLKSEQLQKDIQTQMNLVFHSPT